MQPTPLPLTQREAGQTASAVLGSASSGGLYSRDRRLGSGALREEREPPTPTRSEVGGQGGRSLGGEYENERLVAGRGNARFTLLRPALLGPGATLQQPRGGLPAAGYRLLSTADVLKTRLLEAGDASFDSFTKCTTGTEFWQGCLAVNFGLGMLEPVVQSLDAGAEGLGDRRDGIALGDGVLYDSEDSGVGGLGLGEGDGAGHKGLVGPGGGPSFVIREAFRAELVEEGQAVAFTEASKPAIEASHRVLRLAWEGVWGQGGLGLSAC